MNSLFSSLLPLSLTLLLPHARYSADGVEYLENGIAKLSGGDIDVQTCVDNFDTHKDNIIRTQDSRAMGAKYLSEIELDSRLECLRLCCETEHCDVFVYEDKGPGSCYLFECGPPKDFKCKFTHHVNYTSGILGVNRHPNNDLEVEIQREKDRNRLRKPNYNNDDVPQRRKNGTVALSVPSVKPMAAVIASASNRGGSALDKGTTKCSRNQFECRTSNDCIAIYNACDGVPQCPDGSDEAIELGCPDASGTTGVPLMAAPNGPLSPSKFDLMGSQNINRLNNHATLVDGKQRQMAMAAAQDDYSSKQIVSHNSIGREGVVQQDYNTNRDRDGGQQQMLQFPSSGYLKQQQQQQSLLYSSQQQQQEVPLSVDLPRLPQTNWFPHTSPNNVPSGLSALPEQSSHIFNHKVNGLQVADTDAQTLRTVQQQYSLNDLNQRERDYQQQAPPNGYYSDIYNNKPPQPIPQINPNWQRNPETGLFNQQQNGDSYKQKDLSLPQDNWQSKEPPVELSPKHEQEAMAHELKHSKEHFEAHSGVDVAAMAPVAKEREHDHTKYAVVVDELAETVENIEDGVAQTPGGAVLSLILGLLITCMLAILIGCRLRVVRRRIRRGGGKSYAHDADYLVNGMYL